MLRMSLRPSVVAAYISALLVCATGWFAYSSVARSASSVSRSRGALREMAAVRALSDGIQDANIAERDLAITGDLRFAVRFAAASDRAVQSLSNVRDLAPPLGIASRVDSLGYFVRLRLAELEESVRAERGHAPVSRRAIPGISRSTQADEAIGRFIAAIGATIERRDSGTAAASAAEGTVLLLMVGAAAVLSIVLALFANYRHARNVRVQRRLADELGAQSAQLELQRGELSLANQQVESARSEMLRQTMEAERSEARLAGILGSATDAVVAFSDDERLVYSNAAARRLLSAERPVPSSPRILDAV
ncbi:MAG: hypothetical protein M3R65_06765, partial [Gemmatimonadota bacterium]|nr:hypothetical protein [Gemmatimonadota bacterium]